MSVWWAAPKWRRGFKNQKEEERVVSKSRSALMKMSSYPSSYRVRLHLKVRGFDSFGKSDSRTSAESSSFDAASTSQVRLQDAHLHGLHGRAVEKPVASRRTNSEESDNPETEVWTYEGESVVHSLKAWEKSLTHGVSSSVDQKSQKNTEATWDHYLHISSITSSCMEVVFSMVRKIYGKTTRRSHGWFEGIWQFWNAHGRSLFKHVQEYSYLTLSGRTISRDDKDWFMNFQNPWFKNIKSSLFWK